MAMQCTAIPVQFQWSCIADLLISLGFMTLIEFLHKNELG
jgi:hypothetical protein